MISVSITDYSVIIAFWLAFVRMLAILVQLPIFDNISIPMMVKVLSTLLITYAFFPFVETNMLNDLSYIGMNNFWYLTIYNVVIGLGIGYLVKVIFNVYTAAGTLITQQIGFGALRYFDPNASQRLGPFESLIQWVVLIMILSSGALYPMFKGVFGSFQQLQVYSLGHFAHSPAYFASLFKTIFLSALLLASPLIFTNIFVMIVLGVIARTVPQMNVLMVSFVVNIGLGLLVFAATSDEFFQVAYRIYTERLAEWFHYVS